MNSPAGYSTECIVLYNKPLLRGRTVLSLLHQVQGRKERGRRRVCVCGTRERSDDGGINVEAMMSSLLEPDGSKRESFNLESL
jgi:hypothetical protein